MHLVIGAWISPPLRSDDDGVPFCALFVGGTKKRVALCDAQFHLPEITLAPPLYNTTIGSAGFRVDWIWIILTHGADNYICLKVKPSAFLHCGAWNVPNDPVGIYRTNLHTRVLPPTSLSSSASRALPRAGPVYLLMPVHKGREGELGKIDELFLLVLGGVLRVAAAAAAAACFLLSASVRLCSKIDFFYNS